MNGEYLVNKAVIFLRQASKLVETDTISVI